MARTYDPGSIVCSFLGIPIAGYADGTFVKAERNQDSYTLMVGAGGEAARARARNTSGRVTFTLMQSSPCNDLLSAAQQADELTGIGVGPLMIKDMNGTTLVMAGNAWIVKPPAVEFGKEITAREWVIECEALTIYSGGTTSTGMDV